MLPFSLKKLSWNFYSQLIIISYLTLQVTRWPILPQFMDIYYHLSTAWGFVQAGGYSGWDFWQYAPAGRIHIYPPFFHIILAGLLKIGISAVILAKTFEVVAPVIFLVVLWKFVKRNFGSRLAFFVLFFCNSNFTFYQSLVNHVPATLSLIFCFLALDELFQANRIRCFLLLLLSFYTHIGISWFFILTIFLLGLFDRRRRKHCMTVIALTLVFSIPPIFKQLSAAKVITSIGLSLNETYILQFKPLEYLLALAGLILLLRKGEYREIPLRASLRGSEATEAISKKRLLRPFGARNDGFATVPNDKKYLLFACMFLASFIYLCYPYRYFCAEGYLPIIFLCAFSFHIFYEKYKHKWIGKPLFFLAMMVILFLSPTLYPHDPVPGRPAQYRLKLFDSGFLGMLFVRGESTWFPDQYLSAASIIKDNSQGDDIIYSNLDNIGLTLSSISGRASANALLPEIRSAAPFDRIAVSRIIILTRDDDPAFRDNLARRYSLSKIGETKIFVIYKNEFCRVKANIRPASVPFWAIACLFAIFALLYSAG